MQVPLTSHRKLKPLIEKKFKDGLKDGFEDVQLDKAWNWP
jgi:hypothetical protein